MSTIIIEGCRDRIKKQVARRLIETGGAEWVLRGVSIRQLEREKYVPVFARSVYIPPTLPSAEIPGVRFVPPAGWVKPSMAIEYAEFLEHLPEVRA